MEEDVPLALLLPDATDKTMLMIQNITTSITRDELVECVNSNFLGHYDFLYLPWDGNGSVRTKI